MARKAAGGRSLTAGFSDDGGILSGRQATAVGLRGGRRVMALGVVCALAAWALAQAPAEPAATEQPSGQPMEYGIRFTPGIARAVARSYVQDVLVQRYKLDASKVEQATEAVARRFMDMAHQFDDAGFADKFGQMIEGVMAGQTEQESSPAIQPRSGKAIADAMKPAMPGVRDLIRGIAQDVRPMLAPKEQLRFGSELLAFTTAMNAFDEALDRWSKGDVRPGENPFEGGGKPKLDESGQSAAYKAAQQMAQRDLDKGEWDGWAQYVEEAKRLYALDEGQAAGANSILSECLDHAAQYTKSEDWRRKVERNRVWINLFTALQIGPAHPLRYCLDRNYGQLLDPIHAIGEELKQRIDAIPTAAQRREADERILKMVGEKGFVEKPESPGGDPCQPARVDRGAGAVESAGSDGGV